MGRAEGSCAPSEHIHITSTTSNNPQISSKSPLIDATGIIPSDGQRILIPGGRDSLPNATFPDDAYADDAV